jgi:site-specific DNA-methyltransferase (adenine-specific)
MSRTDWETPQNFFDTLNKEFNFDIDVCANHENHKLDKYFSPEDNGLTQEWNGTCWMNPPYDRSIGLWLKKAHEESQKGNTIVCLIQGRSTDTIWWHDHVMKSSEIRFIKNRLHFGIDGNHARANISSVVVIFLPYSLGPPRTCSIDTAGHRLYE